MPPTRLPDRALFWVSGTDAEGFLQGLVTANIAGLAPGDHRYAALLTPQGKVLSAFFVRRQGGNSFLIDALGDDRDALMRRLTIYKLRAAVNIKTIGDDDFVVVAGKPYGGTVPDARLADLGTRAPFLEGEDTPSGDPRAYHARRIALGVPEFGYDYGPNEVFPMDVNLDALGAVDYKKGCFVGQEVASRMFRKGEVRKRSWRVVGEAPLTVGASVTAGASTLGAVTSADGAAGIALVRVDRIAATEGPIQADGVPVTLAPPDYLA